MTKIYSVDVDPKSEFTQWCDEIKFQIELDKFNKWCDKDFEHFLKFAQTNNLCPQDAIVEYNKLTNVGND